MVRQPAVRGHLGVRLSIASPTEARSRFGRPAGQGWTTSRHQTSEKSKPEFFRGRPSRSGSAIFPALSCCSFTERPGIVLPPGLSEQGRVRTEA